MDITGNSLPNLLWKRLQPRDIDASKPFAATALLDGFSNIWAAVDAEQLEVSNDEVTQPVRARFCPASTTTYPAFSPRAPVFHYVRSFVPLKAEPPPSIFSPEGANRDSSPALPDTR